jgi:hypothetical protein
MLTITGMFRGVRIDNTFEKARYFLGVFVAKPDGYGGTTEVKFEVCLGRDDVEKGVQSAVLQFRDKLVVVPVNPSVKASNDKAYLTYYLDGEVKLAAAEKPAAVRAA